MKHSPHTMYRLFTHFSSGRLLLWINILSYLDGKYNFDQYSNHDFKACSNLSGFVSKFIIESSLLSFENEKSLIVPFCAKIRFEKESLSHSGLMNLDTEKQQF